MSEVLVPGERRTAGWPTAAALVLLAWAAGLPVAYLLILLHLAVPRAVVPLLLVGWAVLSVALTLRVRGSARRSIRPVEMDGRRAAFGTVPQRAALLMNAVLLLAGAVSAALVAAGGIGFSTGSGPRPGLVVGVVWGFLLLAATVPTAVLNGLWSLDRRTAAEEAAVLGGRRSGARRVLRFARALAAVTWTAYGALAILVLVWALRGPL